MEQGHTDDRRQPHIGPYRADRVTCGNALELAAGLPDGSVSIVCTSPPYWGQRASVDGGIGNEEDPREYIADHATAANQRLEGNVPVAREGGAVQPTLFGTRTVAV